MSTNRILIHFNDLLERRFLANKVSGSLTGQLEDLKKLLIIGEKKTELDINGGLQAFIAALESDIANNSGMARLFVRVGKSVNSRGKKKLIGNLIYNWGVVGNRIQNQMIDAGTHVPSLIVISPSMKCNLRCTGCYSGLYSKDGELNRRDIENILDQCRKLGIYFVVISGGEPYVSRDMLLKIFKKYNDMYFLTYTNGTLLDESTVKTLARLGNVAPAISVEGYREETEKRRGPGVYDKVIRAMKLLKQHGVLFGISVTYTRENIEVITQVEFIQHYIDLGAIFGWYFMFMPVGKDPILDLVPTPEQRLFCGQKVMELRNNYPIFLADFWNDGPAVGGCMAGGRNYLHILNSGRIEACVFAHFGVDNIRDKTLLEAISSPFFKSIRRRFPYSENGNLMRPCAIIDNPTVLREAVEEHLIPEGHAGSDAIIRDPSVIRWIDDYAHRFKMLTDPLWESRIRDPKDRWYRYGDEYKALFRFQESAPKKGRTKKEETVESHNHPVIEPEAAEAHS